VSLIHRNTAPPDQLLTGAAFRYPNGTVNSTPQENTQALPPGTRLEEFIIERVLGSGGFGITYLARDTRLDRKVVIKENLPVQFAWRDWYQDNYTGPTAIDPTGPDEGTPRVYRGGSWSSFAARCRAAYRGGDAPGFRNRILGFRPAMVPSE